MKNINIGIVGCGYAGKVHSENWRRVKGARIVALCDTDEQRAADAAKDWNIPSYYTKLDDMLVKSNVDVISVTTPPSTHASIAIEAMERGCHVLVEKPFTTTTKEADDVLECYNRNSAKLTVCHNRIFSAPWRRARSLLDSSKVGKITGMTVTMLTSHLDGQAKDEHHWAHRLKGGFLGESMPHLVYPLTSVLGNHEVKHVSIAKVGRLPWMPADELAVTLLSEKGTLSTIYWNADAPTQEHIVDIYGTDMSLKINEFTYSLIKNKALPPDERVLRNMWIRGVLNMRVISQSLSSTLREAFRFAIKRSGFQALAVIIDQFKESIFFDKPLPVDPREAREVVRLTEEICEEIERLKTQGQIW
jgi:predicted dehydrogenase